MVNTVAKSITILDILAVTPNLGITELAQICSLPKSSVHNILKTLESYGIVERSDLSGKYQLGLKLIQLGHKARMHLDICKISAPFLSRINQEYNETVHLTVLDRDEVLYVDCIESTKRLRTYSVTGIRAPLYCTAVGKAILAFMEDEEILRIAEEKGLKRITENTITTKERLLEEMKTVKKQGYSIDNMEHEEHLCCVGAPIKNASGNVFASISLSGPSVRVKDDEIIRIANSLMNAANEISRKHGYVENK
jgi:DNA-binding IclR family transcriptional regulator